MQLFQLRGDRYIVQFRKKYSWEDFRKVSKVTPGKYSADFAKKLYSSVFENSTDLLYEYDKYYKDEYDNINKFLFWRHGVSEEIQKHILTEGNSYLSVFELDWRLEDNDILKKTFISILTELDK
jgi:hypothetical protein